MLSKSGVMQNKVIIDRKKGLSQSRNLSFYWKYLPEWVWPGAFKEKCSMYQICGWYRDFSERVSERFLENSTKYFEEKRKLLVNKEYEG